MKNVYIVADNILSPLGNTSAEVFGRLVQGASAVQQHTANEISGKTFAAALFNDASFFKTNEDVLTGFEKMLIASITNAVEQTQISLADKRTILILSSTKGNISLLENAEVDEALEEKISLHHSAKMIATHFDCANDPLVVSNACISGSLALLTAKRFLQSGLYDHAVVAGADLITKFILSGFQSFQAVSENACKPFDAGRTGINLGEAAATIVLSVEPAFSNGIQLSGGAVSNDANHISGPSRTGEELCMAINKALKNANVKADNVNYISAHGTATVYNDEMEAQAITLAGMQSVPVNSLKGYFGHTLGAAGVLESVVTIHSMQTNTILPSPGFETLGVSKPIHINTSLQQLPITHAVKTASGFGGGNAALVFSKQ